MSEYLDRIRELHARRDEHANAMRDAVDRARVVGHTWEEIGRVLGVTRQAAQQQFGRVKVIEP